MKVLITDDDVSPGLDFSTLWLNADYDKAAALLRAEVPSVQRDLNLGRVYLRLGLHSEVIQLLEHTTQEANLIEPAHSALAHTMRAVALAAIGRKEEANTALALGDSGTVLEHDVRDEIALNAALVAWMNGELEEASEMLSRCDVTEVALRDPYRGARFLMLKGWLCAARENFVGQATALMEALQLLHNAPKLDIGLISVALYPLAALVQNINFSEAIELLEDLDQQVPWSSGVAMARFEASRALAWSSALRGDWYSSFRRLSILKRIAPNQLAFVLCHLDCARVATIYDQQVLAAAELAEADQLIRAHDWSSLVWEEPVILLQAADLLADRDVDRARELFQLAQKIKPNIPRNAGFAHHRSFAAISDYVEALIYDAMNQRRLARHRAERAYEVFADMGFQWRAAQCALLLYSITGRKAWLHRAGESIEPYPRSYVAQLVERHLHVKDPSILVTARQRAILELALSGLTNDEIAAELGITRNTVRIHMQRIYRAFDVNDRSHLIIEASRYRKPSSI